MALFLPFPEWGTASRKCLTGRKTSAIMVRHDPLRSAQTTEKLTFRGSCQSGQLELTVNQPRKLRRFESFTAHQQVAWYTANCILRGRLPEWSIGADCKSAAQAAEVRILHRPPVLSRFARVIFLFVRLHCPCGAAVAHSLGKTGVMGSIPITGSHHPIRD